MKTVVFAANGGKVDGSAAPDFEVGSPSVSSSSDSSSGTSSESSSGSSSSDSSSPRALRKSRKQALTKARGSARSASGAHHAAASGSGEPAGIRTRETRQESFDWKGFLFLHSDLPRARRLPAFRSAAVFIPCLCSLLALARYPTEMPRRRRL